MEEDKIQVYKELHLNPWPEVLQKIKECNIVNYFIFIHGDLVFSYIRQDYAVNIGNTEQDNVTQKWWTNGAE